MPAETESHWSGPPVLESQMVRLEPFTETHLTERTVAWLNDPKVLRYSENRHRPQSHENCRAYLRSTCDGGHCYWAIHYKARHVGNVTAYIDRNNQTADLAILVGDKSVWGLGVGRESWRLALDWLLDGGGMRKVTAGTMATNGPMLKTMMATGMIEEGRRTSQFIWEDQEVDLVLVAKFRRAG